MYLVFYLLVNLTIGHDGFYCCKLNFCLPDFA